MAWLLVHAALLLSSPWLILANCDDTQCIMCSESGGELTGTTVTESGCCGDRLVVDSNCTSKEACRTVLEAEADEPSDSGDFSISYIGGFGCHTCISSTTGAVCVTSTDGWCLMVGNSKGTLEDGKIKCDEIASFAAGHAGSAVLVYLWMIAVLAVC